MTVNRFLVGIIALLLTIVGLTAHPARADTSASLSSITVTLNKRIWTEKLPDEKPSIGVENHDFGGLPLSGGTFEVYDASALYKEAMKSAGFNSKLWMKEWSEKSIAEIHAAGLNQPLFSETTNLDGKVTFNLPQTAVNAYLFVETSSRNHKYEQTLEIKSAPLMLLLPYFNEQNSYSLNDINIYLKNIGKPVELKKPVQPSKPMKHSPNESSMTRLPSTGQVKSTMSIFGLILLIATILIAWSYRKRNKNK